MTATEPSTPRPAGQRPRRHWLPNRWQALLAFAVALVLLLLNDAFFIESIVVPSSSMEPTVLPNERLWMRHRRGGTYSRFDVVVLKKTDGTRLVKRIVGLPGEEVQIDEGWRVSINGSPLTYANGINDTIRIEAGRHSIQIVPRTTASAPATRPVLVRHTLAAGEFFVLGDNRLASEDSRQIGPIRQDQIEGTAMLAWYSFDLTEHHVRWDRLFTVVR